MSDLVKKFTKVIARSSAPERVEILKMIDAQIAESVTAIQDMTKLLDDSTEEYRQQWNLRIEVRQQNLDELTQVRKLLE